MTIEGDTWQIWRCRLTVALPTPHWLHICLDNERGGGGKSWTENAHGSPAAGVGSGAWSEIFVIEMYLSCSRYFGVVLSSLKGFLSIHDTVDEL